MANIGNTQQQIDYGAAANDGTGDPLRTAFIKTDENFDNVWLAGPVGSNITIINNTVGVNNTNGNLILSPNGVGNVQFNRDAIPRLNNTYNLGAANLRWRSLSVGTGGINTTGNLNLSGIANLQIAGGVDGYVIQTDGAGNLTWVAQAGGGPVGPSGAVQINWQDSFSNQGGTPGDTYSTLQFDSNGMPTLDGATAYQQRVDYSPYLQVLAPRVESTDFGVVAGPGVTVVGYDDTYNTPRSAYFSVQDQSNVTQQWDFGILGYGSNNYSISDRTSGNAWTFGTDGNLTLPANTFAVNYANGDPVVISGGGGAAGNAGDIQINVAGNIGADSTLRYVDNGGEMTLYADYLNAPGIFTSDIYAGDGSPSNITLTTSYGNANWTFGVDGNLTIPGGGAVWTLGAGTAGLTANIADPLQVNLGLDYASNTATLAGNSGVYIQTNSDANSKQWTFGTDGNLTTPGNINFTNDAAIQTNPVTGVTIYGNSIDQSTALTLNNSGDAALWANANVTINSDSQGSNPQWIFDNAGNLTAPGAISAVGDITGASFNTTGTGGDIVMSGGDVTGARRVITTPTALANLTAVAGGRAFANDANLVAVGNFGEIVGNGGANTVPVWSDGENWYIG